jgi:hypothetical protein
MRYVFSENLNNIAHQCTYRTVGPSVADPDPHHFGNLDAHPHQIKIRIRIKVINLQMTSQNVCNMSLYILSFFQGFEIMWKLGLDPDPHQGDKSNPGPHTEPHIKVMQIDMGLVGPY